MCQDLARCITGSNLSYCHKTEYTYIFDVRTNGRSRLKHAYVDECTDSDHTALSFIFKLRVCLNGDKKLNGFNVNEVECILHNLYKLVK